MSYHQQGIFQFSDHDSISDIFNSQDQSYSIRETNNPFLENITQLQLQYQQQQSSQPSQPSQQIQQHDNNNNYITTMTTIQQQNHQQQYNNNNNESEGEEEDKTQIQLGDYWKTIDQIINSIPVGTFHSRILWICGVAFMADGMVFISLLLSILLLIFLFTN